MTAGVPLVDLSVQHEAVKTEVATGLAEVMAAGDFIGGKAVRAFELEYAEFLGVPHCVGVGNGTDALELALRAIGIGPGDEVVLPAHTFVATAEAVVRAGALPVLVDVDPDYLLIDPAQVGASLGRRTRAVMPVHLYGQAAPVEVFAAGVRAAGAVIVEDAAQAQGAQRFERPAGGLGDIAGTSFYPGKNLGAYGDAGAVLTGSAELAERVRLLASHGERAKYDHVTVGFNSRLDTMQAVVLRAKLRLLAEWNDARRTAAQLYAEMLDGVADVRLPATMSGNEHVWHLYVVRVPRRDEVLQQLRDQGIGAGIHYPVPVHLHPGFAHLRHGPGDFPVAEAATREILSLPIYPGITEAQQARIVDALKDAL